MFFKNLLILLSIVLVIASAVQAVVFFMGRNRSMNGHDHFLAVHNQNCSVVFMGSSRCVHSFIPAVFAQQLGIQSYNIGADGHGDIPFQLILIRSFLQNNPKPKNIVMNVDPFIQYNPMDLDSNRNTTEKPNFSRFLFCATTGADDLRRYFKCNAGEKYIPLYALLKYKNLIDCIKMSEGNKWSQNRGFVSAGPKSWDSLTEKFGWAGYHCASSTIFSAYDSIKYEFRLFSDYCTANNIHFMCVQGPAYNVLYSQKHFNAVARMCNELKIDFFDYSVDTSFNNNVLMFRDIYHLNQKGAEELCNRMCKDQRFVESLKK